MSALKVMIFESDRAFAESLKRAFTRRGCTVRIVDDGQIGIDLAPTDPPELIIVAVELPRMSGFAVCNKLKKVPELKDVPVVITSSESSQETFDHHSKLRTRAEDYVHKPISVEDLLQRCAAHVQIDSEPGGDSEEVDFDDLEAVAISDDRSPTTDAELDNIADVAFDNIMIPSDSPGQEAPAPVRVATGQTGAAAKPAPVRGPAPVDDDLDDLTMVASSRSIADLQLAMRPTPRPQPAATGHAAVSYATAPTAAPPPTTAEQERLAARVAELEGQLTAARKDAAERESLAAENARLKSVAEEVPRLRAQADEVPRLRAQADESARLQRELEDLRARSARPSATTTATSREGLELRETLHRKDKELLQLREVANARDKDLLALRETLLQRDLEKADLDEKLLEREREKADLDERHAALTDDHAALLEANSATRAALDQANKQGAAAAEQAARELAAERDGRKRDDEKAHADRDAVARAHDKAQADARVEHDQAVAALRADHARAVAEQEGRYRDAQTAHAKAVAELDARFNDAKAASERSATEAKAAHDKATVDAKAAHDKATADARAASEKAATEAKSAHDKVTADARAASEKAAGEAKAAHDKALADAQATHARELEALGEAAAAAAIAGAAAAAALVAKHEADEKALRDASAAAATRHEAEAKALRDAGAAAAASATRAQGELEGKVRAVTGERDRASQRGDQLAQELAQTRGELERARALAARNAALLERARRAALIAAGLVEETARPLDDAAAMAGNAE